MNITSIATAHPRPFVTINDGEATRHICGSGEYNSSTGLPTVQSPNISVAYLVPSGRGIYNEFFYRNDTWELFATGVAEIELDSTPTAESENGVTSGAVYQALAQVSSDLTTLRARMNTIMSSIGSPLKASTAAAMTNYDKVYVYTGSEQDYTSGNWYYYDGNNWVSGGVYNSAAISTDKTLSVEDEPADAAAVGDVVSRVAATESTVYDLGTQVGTALNNVSAIDNDITDLQMELGLMQDLVNTKADHFEVGEDGLLYIYANEELIAELGPFAGGGGGGGQGGGGGSTNNAEMSIENTSGWSTKTLPGGVACPISFTWSSIEDEEPTGDGSLVVYVNGSTRITRGVQQGLVTIDVASYLQNGRNSIRVVVYDTYENMINKNYTVNVVTLNIRSSFDNSIAYSGSFTFPFTLTGEVEKTAYVKVDGTTVSTQVTELSNRQLTATISAQSHGTHVIEAYCTAEINGETIQSNTLRYEVICIVSGNTTPIITSDFTTTTVEQYTNIVIKYRVYDPVNLSTSVSLKVNGTTINTITVDRTEQTWSYRADEDGSLVLSIHCGEATPRTFNITVTESTATIGAVTEGLELYLTAQNRHNGEANPSSWSYGNISATLTGFNWVNDGWINDDDGNTVLRVSGGARVSIPFQIFARDFRSEGKTIEIEFSTHQVKDYDAPIISCMSGDRGIEITSQEAVFKSEQTEKGIHFKEDEHVRLTYVVEKRSENRLIYIYINGIMSAIVQYPDVDDFSQISPVGISIGSSYSTTDIYCIRIYNTDLTRQQVLGNWIADTQDVEEMLDRYLRNNVFNENGKIVINKLPSNLPYFILNAPELPQRKGDKKTISGEYVDPVVPRRSFTFDGCQINVQGTSSAPYYKNNYDLQFKGGFDMYDGSHAETYALRDSVVPFNRFVLKADVASSEGANNVELVKLFNDINPYKRPEMLEDAKVRWGIDGYPCIVFWHNTTTGDTDFLGKRNLPK